MQRAGFGERYARKWRRDDQVFSLFARRLWVLDQGDED